MAVGEEEQVDRVGSRPRSGELRPGKVFLREGQDLSEGPEPVLLRGGPGVRGVLGGEAAVDQKPFAPVGDDEEADYADVAGARMDAEKAEIEDVELVGAPFEQLQVVHRAVLQVAAIRSGGT
jgi:hypothetical protein